MSATVATEWATKRDGVSYMEMTVLAADVGASWFGRSMGFLPSIEHVRVSLPPKGGA